MEHLSRKTKLPKLLYALVIVALFVGFAVPEYRGLTKSVRDSEHIDATMWDVMQWIHASTRTDDKVLFLEGGYQESAMYAKRLAATVPLSVLEKNYAAFVATGSIDPRLTVEWTGRTLRDAEAVADSPWKYHYVEEWSSDVALLDFDYVVIQNIHPALVQFNDAVGKYLSGQDYTLAYTKGSIGVYQRGGVA